MLEYKQLRRGFLPAGLFTRLIGRVVQWAQLTSNQRLGHFGLFLDAGILSFGHQRFRICVVPDIHTIKVEGKSELHETFVIYEFVLRHLALSFLTPRLSSPVLLSSQSKAPRPSPCSSVSSSW